MAVRCCLPLPLLLPLLLLEVVGLSRGYEVDSVQMGLFASVSRLQDKVVVEGELVNSLERYYEHAKDTLEHLNRYLASYRSLDLVGAMNDPSPSLEHYLEQQRLASQKKVQALRRRLLQAKRLAAPVSCKGDTAWFQDHRLLEDESRNTEAAAREANLLEEQIQRILIGHEEEAARLRGSNHTRGRGDGSGGGGGGVQHPVDGYLFMKRMSNEWLRLKIALKELRQHADGLVEEAEEERDRLNLPDLPDLHGAASAIVTLHHLHHLPLHHLADGRLVTGDTELVSRGRLNTYDLILLGKQACKLGLRQRAVEWFRLAVQRGAAGGGLDTPEERQLLTQLTDTISQHEVEDGQPADHLLLREEPKGEEEEQMEEEAVLARLCSGEKLTTADPSLHCRLESHGSPLLLLSPLRVEEMSLSPPVLLYRQLLSPAQTQLLVRRARNSLLRAEPETDSQFDSNMSVGYLKEVPGDRLESVSRLIEAATGRRPAGGSPSSQQYMVTNYGIGGHALPGAHLQHQDAMAVQPATLLITLSDVQAGGWTVFPGLLLQVVPERGSALLLPSHSHLTRRADCPVLYGNKWTATTWLSDSHQPQQPRCCDLEQPASHESA